MLNYGEKYYQICIDFVQKSICGAIYAVKDHAVLQKCYVTSEPYPSIDVTNLVLNYWRILAKKYNFHRYLDSECVKFLQSWYSFFIRLNIITTGGGHNGPPPR